jgi:hypothetical protein
MPLTSKGEEIKEKMEHEYGSKKGEEVFYASKNKGTISGVDGVGMECADQPGISPYYGDPPLDPTSIAPPPNSNAEQPSSMAEPVDGSGAGFRDNSTFNPPPIGDAEMSPVDAFAAIGRAVNGDAWDRMTGNRDFSDDEHSGMGRLPREVSFKQMRGMAEGFGYNQGNQGDPYKK